MREHSAAVGAKNGTVGPATPRPMLQRRCACESREPRDTCPECGGAKLRRRGAAPSPSLAPPIVHRTLGRGGHPLDAAVRAEVEPHFNFDFSRVRIHDDREAQASTRAVGAEAYTVGSHVVLGESSRATADSRVLLHELAHVVQQRAHADVPLGRPLPIGEAHDAHEHEAERASQSPVRSIVTSAPGPRVQRRGPAAVCSVTNPENCPTYQQWIATFASLPTFPSRDTIAGGTQTMGFDVLGPRAAVEGSTGTTAPPPRVHPSAGDHFIDHPTDDWVRHHLPDELRTVAYMLPADCADVALVLRHVWLFAHNRTEHYTSGGRTWTIGVQRHETARQRRHRIFDLIVNQVYSGNVRAMVNPYTNASGHLIRSFAGLDPLLNVGDVLVWSHHAGTSQTGKRIDGHTQTTESITRDANGNLQSMTLLAGNQPIFRENAQEIIQSGQTSATESQLRSAPGRRIERETITRGQSTQDENGIWTQHEAGPPPETTILEVAGPPRAASRPRAAGTTRALTDWVGRLRTASTTTLQGNLEAALQEARAIIEGGGTVSDADARAVAKAAGENLWRRAKAAHDFGNQSHYERLYRMRAAIRALGGIYPVPSQPNPHASNVRATFLIIDDQFEMAARGATSIDFHRRTPHGTRLLKVLVTGFDPFNATGGVAPPSTTRWNPAGAAALALDGTVVDVQSGVKAAVETVVLPVSFQEFAGGGTSAGIVERIVGPLATSVDAVITVSEDPGIRTNQVRIEQFSVGTHELASLSPHRLFPTETVSAPRLTAIPAAPGGRLGPAIIESNAPVAQIASDTADTAHGVNRPAIGPPGTQSTPVAVTLNFDTAAKKAQAARILGMTVPAAGTRLELSSASAVESIIRGAWFRDPHPEKLDFFLFDPRIGLFDLFTAEVVSGPGGNFLSNEVAYRTQRLLQAHGTSAPLSFHVHTQGAGPTTHRGPATTLRNNTIHTLRRIVRAVGLELVRRAASSRQPSTQHPSTTHRSTRRP